MIKKLSKKERGEIVTKGFLEDYLNDVLEFTINNALEKQSKEFRQYIDTMIEYQLNSIQTFMENMDERYVLRREWLDQKLA